MRIVTNAFIEDDCGDPQVRLVWDHAHVLTVELSTGTIAYRTSGEGRPVVLVHGNSSSSRAFCAQLERPLPGARLVAIDLPGHGQSLRASTYPIEMFTTAIAELESALELAGAIYVGHSLGGHLLLQAAGRVRPSGIVVFGTPPLTRPPELGKGFLPHPVQSCFFRAEITDDEIAEWERACFARIRGTSEFAQQVRSTDPRVRSSIHEAIASRCYRDEVEIIRSLPVPLAILRGSDDALVDREYLEQLDAPTLWEGRVHVIERSGHYPHIEAPERFGELLVEFLEFTDSRAGDGGDQLGA